MTMLRWLALLSLLFATLLHAEPPSWPHEQSDLKPDPRVTFGRLENGFRYMVLPHPKPAGRVTLYLLVEAGSYQEGKDERGLAHFVEHMVFNGSRDFPDDEAIRTLQRFGLSFGPDVNAGTSMLQTCYHFENLPVADADALPTGLKILRNFADGALFTSQAVDKERKVILAEARAHAGAMAFAWERELEFLPPRDEDCQGEEITSVFSGTRIEHRISPIGPEKVIARATSKQLRTFYDRWYRPERMILAVVGDLDAAATEKRIAEAFATLQARSPASKPEPITGPAKFTSKLHVLSKLRPGLPQAHVTLASAIARPGADSSARRAAELPDHIALSLVAQRLERALEIPGAVDGVSSHAIPGWQLPLLRVTTPAEHWKAASTAMITEVRRAQQHGFATGEIEQATESFKKVLMDDERDNSNRTAPELARALAYAAARGVVFTDAATDRQLDETALATITPAACLDAVRRLWPESLTSLTAWGPINKKDTKDISSIAEAWDAKPEPTEQSETKPFPYTDFGPAGSVVAQRHDAALDCWFVQFANGVRLTIKPTKFAAGEVKVNVRFGHGSLGSDRPGMGMAIGALVFGGLRELSFEELGMTIRNSSGGSGSSSGGMQASMSFVASGESDCFNISETLSGEDLPLGLQIATAFLTAPGFRESAEPQMRAIFEPQFAAHEQTAAGAADYALKRALSSEHPTTRLPSIAGTRQISFNDFRDHIAPQLLNSPLEATLVGDLSLDDAIAITARTLGALPPRPTDDALASRRACAPPALPQRETVRFKGKKYVGSVALAWTVLAEPGQHDDCAAWLLRAVIRDRLRLTLRQEMGETYSPNVEVWLSADRIPAMLTLRSRIETAPRHVDRVSKAMHKVIAQLVREGVSDDELERARKPLVHAVEAELTSNDWWLQTLGEAQSKPQFLIGVADRLQICRTITREEINTLARTLLTEERCCEIRAVPK